MKAVIEVTDSKSVLEKLWYTFIVLITGIESFIPGRFYSLSFHDDQTR